MKRLVALLGPKPTHPWAALIPQLLLWSFRRFCVEKLLVSSDALLLEQVWDDHLELIRNWGPRGLEEIGLEWLSPENVDTMHSTLAEWNTLLLDSLELIDEAVAEEDEALQVKVSEFLDEEIAEAIKRWLDGPERAFLIFPLKGVTNDGEFTDQQMLGLIRGLRDFSGSLEPAASAEPERAEPERAEPEHLLDISQYEEQSPANSDSEEEIEEKGAPEVAAALPEPPVATTVAAAMRRRRTFRCRGPNANRAITLRRLRARRRTKRVAAASSRD